MSDNEPLINLGDKDGMTILQAGLRDYAACRCLVANGLWAYAAQVGALAIEKLLKALLILHPKHQFKNAKQAKGHYHNLESLLKESVKNDVVPDLLADFVVDELFATIDMAATPLHPFTYTDWDLLPPEQNLSHEEYEKQRREHVKDDAPKIIRFFKDCFANERYGDIDRSYSSAVLETVDSLCVSTLKAIAINTRINGEALRNQTDIGAAINEYDEHRKRNTVHFSKDSSGKVIQTGPLTEPAPTKRSGGYWLGVKNELLARLRDV